MGDVALFYNPFMFICLFQDIHVLEFQCRLFWANHMVELPQQKVLSLNSSTVFDNFLFVKKKWEMGPEAE